MLHHSIICIGNNTFCVCVKLSKIRNTLQCYFGHNTKFYVGRLLLFLSCRFRMLAEHFLTMYPNLNVDIDSELQQLKVNPFTLLLVPSAPVLEVIQGRARGSLYQTNRFWFLSDVDVISISLLRTCETRGREGCCTPQWQLSMWFPHFFVGSVYMVCPKCSLQQILKSMGYFSQNELCLHKGVTSHYDLIIGKGGLTVERTTSDWKVVVSIPSTNGRVQLVPEMGFT